MWDIKKQKGIPIYQNIIRLIIDYIKTGRLLPGEKIPSERKLAEYFAVNRSTVVRALDELEAMGVIIRKQGSGTRISEEYLNVFTGKVIDWHRYLAQGFFKQTHPYVERLNRLSKDDSLNLIDAHTGELPLSLIPTLELPSITWKDFLIEENHQDILGYIPLREQLAKRLNKEHDLNLSINQILLTSGAQQALFMIVQVLLQRGDTVAIEDPSFLFSLSIFKAAGIKLCGIPVDHRGMKVESLEEKIIRDKIKIVIVNPNFQNPTGTTMSLNRRRSLIELCQKYEIPIVEDDVFGQLFFKDEDKPILLKELDKENVIYIGSLSKILGSTTKIGWLCAPAKITHQIAQALREMDTTLSIFPQVLAYYALTNPYYEEKLNLLRKELILRRNYLVEELEKEFGDQISLTIPKGGYYLWVQFLDCHIEPRKFDYLLDEYLLAIPGFLFGSDRQSIRLNFAHLTKTDGIEAVKRMKNFFEKIK